MNEPEAEKNMILRVENSVLFLLFLFATYTDADKFSVAAVARCTSMVKSPTENYYKLDATIPQTGEICRVVGQSSVESQEYTMSAELLNQAGWQGINSGHPGVLFNAVDENNFDFVYFR